MKNPIRNTLLALGLVGALTGCGVNSDSPSLEVEAREPESYTNEVLALGRNINNQGVINVLSQDTNKEIKFDYLEIATPIRRDLPDNSKPLLVSRGNEKVIHIPSNSTFVASFKDNYFYNLQLADKSGDKQ